MTQPESLNRMDNVDRTADPHQYVNYLDQVSGRESTKVFKQHTFALMGAREGSHLLDVGCGTGEDVRAMAQLVGPGGRVVGVDSSETMIAEARKRSDELSVPVEFYAGNIYQLDFADNTFDASRADRVFMHLNDPRKALAEMKRVVKPGGCVVVDDPDWETMVVDTSDRVVTRKIWHYASPAQFTYLNPYGKYEFDLAANWAEGVLRPLRLSPTATGELSAKKCSVGVGTSQSLCWLHLLSAP